MGRPVTRGVLVKEEHVETLRRLPAKTMDAVVGAAFRAAIGMEADLAVKDPTGILVAMVQSIAVAAQKFDENEVERKAKDAERKRKEREIKEKKALLKMLEAHDKTKNHGEDDEFDDEEHENHDGGKTLCDTDEEKCDTLGESVAMSRGQRRTKADKGGQKRTKADKSGQKRTKAESAQKERKKEGKNIYTPIVPKGDVKGDDLPSAIDVDALLGIPGTEAGDPRDGEAGDPRDGEAGGDEEEGRGIPPQECGGTGQGEDGGGTGQEEDGGGTGQGGDGGGTGQGEDGGWKGQTVAEVAAAMAAEHPNASDTDSFPRTLARYLKKNGGALEGGQGELLEKIAAAHRRWIASGAWSAEGGRYAPKLKNWLWGGDWRREPQRAATEGRRHDRATRRGEDADFHAGASL